jgi:hypothetical protein
MQIVKDFNLISDELKKTIPAFEAGDIFTFEMLNGVVNTDDDPREVAKTPKFFPATQIPLGDRIFDPYSKSASKYVNIGVVDEWNEDRPVRYKTFVAGLYAAQFSGKFSLSGDNLEHREIFEILWLSNLREDNPNRDKTKTPLFKFIDIAAISQNEEDELDTLDEALTKARDISEEDAKHFIASINGDVNEDFKQMKVRIRKFANANPKEFLSKLNDPEKEIKSIIKIAMDAQIVKYDTITGAVTNGASSLTNIKYAPEVDILKELAAWFGSAANGATILEGLKKELKKKKLTK